MPRVLVVYAHPSHDRSRANYALRAAIERDVAMAKGFFAKHG